MPTSSQRHPSRDEHPSTGDFIHKTRASGQPIFQVIGHGHYEPEELKSAASYWHDEGMPEQAKTFEHMQGALFDVPTMERGHRHVLGMKRMPSFDAYGNATNEEHADRIRTEALDRSVIPASHLQPRRLKSGEEAPESRFVVEHGLVDRGIAGHYTGPALSQHQTDYVTVDPGAGDTSTTAIHEMGHRQHLGTRETHDPAIHHPRGQFPDPLKEAHADAYVDRYGGSDSSQVREMTKDIEHSGRKFPSYQYTGYSTRDSRWNPEDQALYAAVRGHASETGEHTDYKSSSPAAPSERESRVSPTIDATLHSLLSTSPHAVQALRQTGLKDVGAAAFRRHQDRQLMSQGQNVQDSLFSDVRNLSTGQHVGYTPSFEAVPDVDKWETGFDSDMEHMTAKAGGEFVMPRHMSKNQFGESPRSQYDVRMSLGISPHDSRQRGFT